VRYEKECIAVRNNRVIDYDEKAFIKADFILQEIPVAIEIDKMSLLSLVLPVRTRGGREIWFCEGRFPYYMENTSVQSFFKRGI